MSHRKVDVLGQQPGPHKPPVAAEIHLPAFDLTQKPAQITVNGEPEKETYCPTLVGTQMHTENSPRELAAAFVLTY